VYYKRVNTKRGRARENMKKVTIKQIADEMGLSRNTVAKALTNNEVVAYNTRRAVIAKAKELGYQKLLMNAAREITSEKNPGVRTIVVLAYAEISAYWNEIILGISEELKKHEFRLRFNFISREDEADLLMPIDWEDPACGIIFLSVFSDKFIMKAAEKKIPMVFLDSAIDTARFMKYGDVIMCEGRDAVKKIVQKLISQGVRDYAFVGDISYCKSVRERYNGFLEALNEEQIKPESALLLTKHVNQRYYVRSEVEQAMETLPRVPKAVICANDDIALFVNAYLKKKQIRVPEDVLLTGFDNLESLTHVETFLTTVNVENQLLGRRLVQQLIFRMSQPEFRPELIQIGCEVIFRQSTKCTI